MIYYIVIAIMGVLVLMWAGFRVILGAIRDGGGQNNDKLIEAIKGMVAPNPPETPSEHGDVLERVEKLERRIDTVHEDVLRNLAKSNTRLRRARQLAGEDEEEEMEEATPEQLEQAALELTPQPAAPDNGPLSIEQLRSIANGGL